jgi:hypothetical protein
MTLSDSQGKMLREAQMTCFVVNSKQFLVGIKETKEEISVVTAHNAWRTWRKLENNIKVYFKELGFGVQSRFN